jgi:hypothetical protein
LPLAVPDLLGCKLASANTAAPTGSRKGGDHWSWRVLRVGKLGTHQFAATRRTLSLNHKLRAAERFVVIVPTVSGPWVESNGPRRR